MTLPPLKWSLASLLGEAVAYGASLSCLGASSAHSSLVCCRHEHRLVRLLGVLPHVSRPSCAFAASLGALTLSEPAEKEIKGPPSWAL